MKTILVTGGAGFIGSNFINWFLKEFDDYFVVNIDKLTYAGNIENTEEAADHPAYRFVRGDISDAVIVNEVFKKYRPDYVVNFAAESHVDRSINDPLVFARSNVLGAATLLDAAHRFWRDPGFLGKRFLQISTDEVYGSIGYDGTPFSEASQLLPNSPYSSSKAGADLMVRAYVKTYGFPAVITRCCNNYGPRQNLEKFIPTCISHAVRNEPIPVYGSGTNIREWIHVLDHCSAITKALFEGRDGEIYNIGSGEEMSNIDLARIILRLLGKPEDMIKMVSDRPGHDFRYALDSVKAKKDLGWSCRFNFSEGIGETVTWYLNNSGSMNV